jgi:adenine-specific DNA-methyltransferase
VHLAHVAENRIWWGIDGANRVPAYKRFLSDVGGVIADTWWDWEDVGHNDEAKKEFLELLPELARSFETPKPRRLIARMIELATGSSEEHIVLDFFAGSGTTGDAVLHANHADDGNRRFIMIQLPEPTDDTRFRTVAEITKQRVKSALVKIDNELSDKAAASSETISGRGFRVFKLAESSFKPWDAEAPKDATQLTARLELHVDHVRDGRSPQDLLFEILLKTGFPLTTPIKAYTIEGKTVFSVADGTLLVCLERYLTLELIRALAEKKPERVVALDAGFAGNDPLKTNAVQIFRAAGVTSFKTV